MGEFKVGDKVKFLNRTGGGIITKIVSPLVVNVQEDGFDIPTLTKEIILDHVEDKSGKIFTSEYKDNKENTSSITEEQKSDSSNTNIEKVFLSRKGQQIDKGIYLAFVPKDQVWILTQGFDVYLINNTEYTAIYSVFLKDGVGMFKGEDFGSLESKERVHLDSIEPAQAEKWSDGVLQMLFYKEKDDKVFAPISYNFKIRTIKFYKEGCFEFHDLMGEKAMVLPITLLKGQNIFMEKDEQKKLLQKIKIEKQDIKVVEPKKEISFFDKHITSKNEAEVDLHIEELTEEESRLQPFEKLNLQMNYFKKCLEEAIQRNFDKIIFIHGVGQGVLKKNIEEELNK
ncbi:MAG: DUF2027 domain-containing protein, partial [Bacteroidota bacterium]|nr:DUF2027 domain-containing protein [Bacteroidota bacterium]